MVAARADQRVWLAMQDTGAGIPSGEVPHVFDPLYRCDGARVGYAGESDSLGLTIARSLVDLHEGRSPGSTLSEGTFFAIASHVGA